MVKMSNILKAGTKGANKRGCEGLAKATVCCGEYSVEGFLVPCANMFYPIKVMPLDTLPH